MKFDFVKAISPKWYGGFGCSGHEWVNEDWLKNKEACSLIQPGKFRSEFRYSSPVSSSFSVILILLKLAEG